MTHETAHKILSAHQAWRRGLVDAMEYTAAEVNEALEFAIAALQSDPDAPDWSQAPNWANYYHKSSDDLGWWYEYEPKKTSYKGFLPTIGRVKLAKAAHPIEKLFKRPDQ